MPHTEPELLSMEMWLWIGIAVSPARGARRGAVARGPAGRAGAPASAGVAPRLVRAVRAAHVRAGDERTYARAVLPWMRPDARPVRRGVQLLVGLVLYAASIAMLVDAGLGSMPWDVLTQGIVAAHGPVVRRRHPADRAGRPGVLDPAAAAPRRRDRRERRRDQRARRPVPRAARRAARRDRRAHRAGGLRHRAQRPGDRPVRRCPPRAGSARRAHDRARRAGPGAPCGWSAPPSR